MDFPRYVFTSPGPIKCREGMYGAEIVKDESEYSAAIEAGFYPTMMEAIEGAKSEQAPAILRPSSGEHPVNIRLTSGECPVAPPVVDEKEPVSEYKAPEPEPITIAAPPETEKPLEPIMLKRSPGRPSGNKKIKDISRLM